MSTSTMQVRVEMVPLGACEVIYRDAQRSGVNEKTVRDIIRDFDPAAVGYPFVAQVNGSGRFHIIDGQNRITAMKRMGWTDDTLIPVEVCQVKSKAEAAHLFTLRNRFRAPSAVDRFLVGVTAGYPEECAVHMLVNLQGFTVGGTSGVTMIAAVSSLVRSYRAHGDEALSAALAAIGATWKADPDRTRGEIIEGWAKLFGYHGQVVDPKRLASRIGKKYTAGNLIAAARASSQMFGGTVVDNVLRATVAHYNAGLRTSARVELDG